MRTWIGGALAAGLALLVGCGGGGGSGDGDDSGVWDLSFNTTNPRGQQETISMRQDGSAITGETSGGGTVTGTAQDNSANITIIYQNNYSITMNLTINVNVITGSFTDTEGRQGAVNATGPGSGGGNTSGGVNVAGSWNVTKVITAGPEAGRSGSGTVTLTQNGRSIAGTGTSAGVSGTIDGSSVSLTILGGGEWEGNIDWWTGTVSGNSMSGTWTDNQGSSGTWTATRM